MTPRKLQAIIQQTAACAPHALADGPNRDAQGKRIIKSTDIRARDQAVADALNASGAAVRLTRRDIGEVDVLRECGIPIGDTLLGKLAAAGGQALRVSQLLQAAALDIGETGNRAVIESLRGKDLTAAETDALLGMGYRAETITAAQVSIALRGPWGD